MTELRDYQVEAVEKLETAINLGQCPLYVLPTGGGKTIIASHIIERAVAQGKRVLVPTEVRVMRVRLRGLRRRQARPLSSLLALLDFLLGSSPYAANKPGAHTTKPSRKAKRPAGSA